MPRAIMLMFDSLNRHMLPPYGARGMVTPNFERLARQAVILDNFYAGSLPCMPARRELHAGRHNFLHRSWGPLEPWDDSMPELLDNAGIHSHLATDHMHYWEDGGATYHSRYTTWESFRGQEGDPWKADVDARRHAHGAVAGGDPKAPYYRQDDINRRFMRKENEHSQTRTVDAGLEFLERNVNADQWFLQIECFDPHEPFFTYESYRQLYDDGNDDGHGFDGGGFDGGGFDGGGQEAADDWPAYEKVRQQPRAVERMRREYRALVSMCDYSLGRVLDFLDEHDMWGDTLLIVNTDHGFLLGEHGWWAKAVQPWFNELVHLPAFIADPRHPAPGTRDAALHATIDVAPTILDFFGLPIPELMTGRPIVAGRGSGAPTEPDTDGGHSAVLFGIHGGHVNVTDGRYVYMRGPGNADNAPLEEYTMMPTRMHARFTPRELADAELATPLPFTKGVRPLRIAGTTAVNPANYGTLLFDLATDPAQQHPITDAYVERRMLRLLVRLLHDSDAPASQFARLGLPVGGDVTDDHLRAALDREHALAALEPLPPIEDFDGTRPGVTTSVAELLADDRSRRICYEHLPWLGHTELVGLTPGTSLYDLAAQAMITSDALQGLAASLAAAVAEGTDTDTGTDRAR